MSVGVHGPHGGFVSHPRVRFAMVRFADSLLASCPRTLHLSAPLLVEVLLTLASDEDDTPLGVAAAARSSLARLSARLDTNTPHSQDGPTGQTEHAGHVGQAPPTAAAQTAHNALSRSTHSMLASALENTFTDTLTPLPRLLRTANDATRLSRLKLLAGYLALLGPARVLNVLTMPPFLDRQCEP